MKAILFISLFTSFLFIQYGFSQNVGIGTATPDASAKLHIVDANRGLLIPSVSIGNVAAAAPVTAPATGLMVFNTNATTIGGNGTGFYYWSGAQWLKLITAVTSDIDFYEVGTTTSPNNINDNIYTLGNMAVGLNNPGTHTAIFSNTTPAIKLGQPAFNNVESGRFAFEENTISFNAPGTYCGFEFHHNGSANNLSLNVGCTGATMIATFTRSGARMGLKTAAPTADLSVNGTANKTGGGAWAVFSDVRLKENVSEYSEGLDLITKVRPVNFSYNAKMREIWGENESVDGRVYQGVIAQDLRKIAPDMVNEVIFDQSGDPDDADYVGESKIDSERYLEVDPSKFTYALINAVQEQQEMIESQSEELTELEKENRIQKAEIEALNERMKRIEKLFGEK